MPIFKYHCFHFPLRRMCHPNAPELTTGKWEPCQTKWKNEPWITFVDKTW